MEKQTTQNVFSPVKQKGMLWEMLSVIFFLLQVTDDILKSAPYGIKLKLE